MTRRDPHLRVVEIVRDPGPMDVDRLTPAKLPSKDRPILAAAIVAGATHVVTGDLGDFGTRIGGRGELPLLVVTPRQFLETARL